MTLAGEIETADQPGGQYGETGLDVNDVASAAAAAAAAAAVDDEPPAAAQPASAWYAARITLDAIAPVVPDGATDVQQRAPAAQLGQRNAPSHPAEQ